MKILKPRFIFGTLFILASVLAAQLIASTPASALSGSEFQAGRIMDDVVLYNGSSLNVQQIQEFLNAKVPTCDTNGTQPYAGTTRAAYGASRGYPAPYICLKDFRQDTTAKPGEAGLCNGYTVVNQSAAEIINGVAQSCGISQKALIVLLEKEQSLVTDDWPWAIQYRSATGYGCPDTAPCDAEYYGFFNQVYSAARQFKRYAKDSHLFNYAGNSTGFVLYNPNSGCGGSDVAIQNNATAGLYNYTPYQPNQAALNNLYGSGDGCSAYGNRNFWRIHNDWFGSTFGPNFNWSLESQALYTDATKTVNAGNSLIAGTRVYAVIRIRNSGNLTWSKNSTNTIRMGTVRPQERNSSFCDSTWLSCTRAASLQETSVAPGGIGTFEFWIKAPQTGGSYNEYFGPVVEGVQWLRDIGLFYTLHVQSPIYSWQMTSQYAYTDATKTTVRNLATMMPGEKAYIGFKAKNVGNMTWSSSGANPVTVGTINPRERPSVFSPGSNWLSGTRPALMQEATVAPGQTGTFEFWLTAPNQTGVRHERFGLIANGLTWFNDTGLSFYTNVSAPTYSWQFVNQYAYADANRTILANMANMHPGDKVYVRFTAKNTGNVTWLNSGANAVMAGTANPHDRSSAFASGSGWLSGSRPVLMQNPSIAPGQTATFEFVMTAPNAIGEYNERFNLIANNLTWFNDTGLSFYAKIQN